MDISFLFVFRRFDASLGQADLPHASQAPTFQINLQGVEYQNE
jgi:hypothetical protein